VAEDANRENARLYARITQLERLQQNVIASLTAESVDPAVVDPAVEEPAVEEPAVELPEGNENLRLTKKRKTETSPSDETEHTKEQSTRVVGIKELIISVRSRPIQGTIIHSSTSFPRAQVWQEEGDSKVQGPEWICG
jgi:hypothetical protein